MQAGKAYLLSAVGSSYIILSNITFSTLSLPISRCRADTACCCYKEKSSSFPFLISERQRLLEELYFQYTSGLMSTIFKCQSLFKDQNCKIQHSNQKVYLLIKQMHVCFLLFLICLCFWTNLPSSHKGFFSSLD